MKLKFNQAEGKKNQGSSTEDLHCGPISDTPTLLLSLDFKFW